MRLSVAAVVFLLLALPAPARAAVPVRADLEGRLGSVPSGGRVTVERVALADGSLVDLELTRFEVFAPGAVLTEHGPGGAVRTLSAPADRYFRGRVAGDPESLVFLAVGRTLRGFVTTRGVMHSIASEADVYRSPSPGRTMMSVVDPAQVPASLFRCGSDGLTSPVEAVRKPFSSPFAPSSSTTYVVSVALESDFEMYQFFGSSAALVTYMGDLVAAASAIYLRDVNVQLTIASTSTWSSAADPWTQTTTSAALYELGDYWHANHLGAVRTTTHMLSKKNMGGGIAWIGVLCSGDFLCSGGNCGSSEANGHYGGGYGVSASLNGTFSTSNPSLYWDIYCFTHEVGHNFSSPHTHCYSPPVDHCYSGASGCYSGTTTVPPENGTIMSYCHLLSGGYSNLDLVFGRTTEASNAVLVKMRTYVEGIGACLGTERPVLPPPLPPSHRPARRPGPRP